MARHVMALLYPPHSRDPRGHRQERSLSRYQRLVADAERQVSAATADELIRLVDALGRLAGEQFWSLAIVGGSAWRAS